MKYDITCAIIYGLLALMWMVLLLTNPVPLALAILIMVVIGLAVWTSVKSIDDARYSYRLKKWERSLHED